MIKPIRVAITGAAGHIGYSLLFRIITGQMFGPDQPLILHLIEIPVDSVMKALEGVAMELEDIASPLLRGMVLTSDPEVGFKDANWCLLVGAKPRGPGMERADLLKDNGRIFLTHGRIIDRVAADDCRILVVGNPSNTNCMIAATAAGPNRRLPPERYTAMMRLDENRARFQIARKAGQLVSAITGIHIFGNHSPSMFPAFHLAKINGTPLTKVITDHQWLRGPFCDIVGQRGANVIAARGVSSAACAASAIIDHVRDLITPGKIHSVAVQSHGEYGFESEVWAGLPVRTTTPGSYEVVTGLAMDDFAWAKIAATNKELVEERAAVSQMIA